MTDFNDPATAEKILRTYKRWAVVGLSSDRYRPSYGVARFLLASGYEVTPVNPNEKEVLGLRSYPDLASIEGDVEVVDIFRRSGEAGPHVDQAIEVGAKAVWMQLDVIDSEAAQRAHEAGLDVVMDRCPAIDHPRLIGSASPRR